MKKDDCIFCKIVAGEIPSQKIYEDEVCYAFRDIAPMAPEHALVIPKHHVDSLKEEKDEAVLGHLLAVCAKVAQTIGVDGDGYRVATNIGENGAQSVRHLHLHVLGGRKLSEKMC